MNTDGNFRFWWLFFPVFTALIQDLFDVTGVISESFAVLFGYSTDHTGIHKIVQGSLRASELIEALEPLDLVEGEIWIFHKGCELSGLRTG